MKAGIHALVKKHFQKRLRITVINLFVTNGRSDEILLNPISVGLRDGGGAMRTVRQLRLGEIVLDKSNKKCSQCLLVKGINEFYKKCNGKYLEAICKDCKKIHRRRYGNKCYLRRKYLRKTFPWIAHYDYMRIRVSDKNQCYSRKGIKGLLTIKDIEFLWNRDKANSMVKPSLDRIDSDDDYRIDNCRFIEFNENSSRPKSKL